MKTIRNPALWWRRKDALDKAIAEAIEHHRPRRGLLTERVQCLAAIMKWENRQARRP
jgi:hypothetical protein